MFCQLANNKIVPEQQDVDVDFVKMKGWPIFTSRRLNAKNILLFF